jgi:hypothetical protein
MRTLLIILGSGFVGFVGGWFLCALCAQAQRGDECSACLFARRLVDESLRDAQWGVGPEGPVIVRVSARGVEAGEQA